MDFEHIAKKLGKSPDEVRAELERITGIDTDEDHAKRRYYYEHRYNQLKNDPCRREREKEILSLLQKSDWTDEEKQRFDSLVTEQEKPIEKAWAELTDEKRQTLIEIEKMVGQDEEQQVMRYLRKLFNEYDD